MVRRHLILLCGVAVVLALAAGAFAYWTTSGSGAGATTNALNNGTLVLHPATAAGLTPGKSQPVTFTADNPGSSSLFVDTVVTTASVSPATCLAADFSVTSVLENTRVLPGASAFPLPANATITFADTALNQDLCKNAVVTLNAASGSVAVWQPQGAKLVAGASEVGGGQFGNSVAVSADGNTALIGGDGDNGNVGAVWVYTRSGSTWTQQGPKLTGGSNAWFGVSVALSADGNTALIGGSADSGFVGAAWVFTRSGSTWTQQGPKLTGAGATASAQFGYSVALSGDGNTALISGYADTGTIGAAWVFTRSGSTWTAQGSKLTGAGETGNAYFGSSVALSADGNTALIGAFYDNGIASMAGAAWVFTRSGSTWTAQGSKLTGAGAAINAQFGISVALSADGNTALIGGNGNAGAAWVFTRSGSTWTAQGSKLTGAGETGLGHFGASVALSADGNTALIGGTDDNGYVGAGWVLTRAGSTWTAQGSKLSGAGEIGAGRFGASVALSADGQTALIGGYSDNGWVGAVWPFIYA
jgi:hypothetical protein